MHGKITGDVLLFDQGAFVEAVGETVGGWVEVLSMEDSLLSPRGCMRVHMVLAASVEEARNLLDEVEIGGFDVQVCHSP